MQAGLMDVVKASLTGSVIGNLLLVLGLSMLAGGMKWKEQKFSIRAAGTYNSLMVIALIGMTIPALFFYAGGSEQARQNASVGVSVLLLAVYALAMVFSLHTHKHIFNPLADDKEAPAGWSRQKAILVLAGSAVVVGLLSEILVGSVEQAARSLGLSDLFVGVVIVAVIGNAAEHGVAVTVAMRDKMDLSFAIATGSSAQVALFVAPLLVLAGLAIGRPMDLFFEVFELAAMGLAVAAVIMVSQDGESNWFEGSLLLSVYLMMGIVFYFHP
jgi:Ca2+:H+ antiporter